jgi:hypothetical protein
MRSSRASSSRSRGGVTTLREASGDPGRHVLLVGVSAYRHLAGGTGPPHGAHLGLGQLGSPAVSAVRLARWMLEEERNDVPLQSLELLTSPPQELELGGRQLQIAAATTDNVKAAFDRWYERCDGDEQNVAFFYFCGHGMAKEKLALLFEDFYADPDEPFLTALDFEGTHRGMAPCRAATQVLVADACRAVSLETLDSLDFRPRTFRRPRVRGGAPADAPRVYSTGPDSLAWGRAGEPTTFAAALVDALGGRASRPGRGGRWVVTTAQLVEGLSVALQGRAAAGAPPQDASLGGECKGRGVLSILRDAPGVPAVVRCLPVEAARRATLQLDDGSAFSRPPPPEPTDWELEVPAGQYDAYALFRDGSYPDARGKLIAFPPEGGDVCLEVPA